MSTPTPNATGAATPRGKDVPTMAEDLRRMAPIYTGVVVVELLVLFGLWWFQQHFGA